MNVVTVIGPHPTPPHPCGIHLAATDQNTAHAVPVLSKMHAKRVRGYEAVGYVIRAPQ